MVRFAFINFLLIIFALKLVQIIAMIPNQSQQKEGQSQQKGADIPRGLAEFSENQAHDGFARQLAGQSDEQIQKNIQQHHSEGSRSQYQNQSIGEASSLPVLKAINYGHGPIGSGRSQKDKNVEDTRKEKEKIYQHFPEDIQPALIERGMKEHVEGLAEGIGQAEEANTATEDVPTDAIKKFKALSEQGSQHGPISPKSENQIKHNSKTGKVTKMSFGSVNSAIRGDLPGEEYYAPHEESQIETGQSYVDKVKDHRKTPREGPSSDQGQKIASKDRTKPIPIPGDYHLQTEKQRNSLSDELESKSDKASIKKWVPKMQSSSTSSTASSPFLIATHSPPPAPIGSILMKSATEGDIQPAETEMDNYFDVLAEQKKLKGKGKMSEGMEELEEETSDNEDGQSNESSFGKEKSERLGRQQIGKVAAVKSKKAMDHEDRRVIENFIKKAAAERRQYKQGLKLLQKEQAEEEDDVKEEVYAQSENPSEKGRSRTNNDEEMTLSDDSALSIEQQELNVRIVDIVDVINDLWQGKLVYQDIEDPDEKEKKLILLKSTYVSLMKWLENFFLDFRDLYEKSSNLYIYFGDILEWMGGLHSESELKDLVSTMKQAMLESLVYLDSYEGGIGEVKKLKLTNLYELFQKIHTLKGDLDSKGGNEATPAAIKELGRFYMRDVDDQLRESLGYLFIGMKRKPWREEVEKLPIGQGLRELGLALPSRKAQLREAMYILCDLYSLPNFAMWTRCDYCIASVDFSPVISTIAVKQEGIAAASSPSLSSSSFEVPETEEIKTEETSIRIGKTPYEQNQLDMRIELILLEVHSMKNTNVKWLKIEDSRAKREMLQELNTNYQDIMVLLEEFVRDFEMKYKWDRNRYIGDIFTWIFGIYNAEEDEERKKADQKTVMDIMRKSLVLLDEHGKNLNIFRKLIQNVHILNEYMNRHGAYIKSHGKVNENSKIHLKLKEPNIWYMANVDPELRKALSFHFIGMRKEIKPGAVRIERMRESVAQKGLNSLINTMMLEGQLGRFHLLMKTKDVLERFSNSWTKSIEFLIRDDLTRYVAKILGNERKEEFAATNSGMEAKTKENKKVVKEGGGVETAHNMSLTLEQIADTIVFENNPVNNMTMINDLLEHWQPPSQSSNNSEKSSSSKHLSKKGGRKVAKAMAEKQGESKNQELVNRSSWRPILMDALNLIHYMKLLRKLQVMEERIDTKVDGLHVHVRVWTILHETKLSPLLHKWTENYIMKRKHKTNEKIAMKEILEFYAEELHKYFARNGEDSKGKKVRLALEALITMDQQFEMQHRYMHFKRLLSSYKPSVEVELEKCGFCNKFDKLLDD